MIQFGQVCYTQAMTMCQKAVFLCLTKHHSLGNIDINVEYHGQATKKLGFHFMVKNITKYTMLQSI